MITVTVNPSEEDILKKKLRYLRADLTKTRNKERKLTELRRDLWREAVRNRVVSQNRLAEMSGCDPMVVSIAVRGVKQGEI